MARPEFRLGRPLKETMATDGRRPALANPVNTLEGAGQ
jgi:hypothetical protein